MKDTALLVQALAELDTGHFLIIGGFLAFIFRERIKSLWPSMPKTNGNAKAAADRANTRLDSHEKECERRHSNIKQQFDKVDQRFDKIENDVVETKAGVSRIEGYIAGMSASVGK